MKETVQIGGAAKGAVSFSLHKARRLPYVGLYGNTHLPKAYCEECGGSVLIVDGAFGCCGRAVENYEPLGYKRESEPKQTRRIPARRDQTAKLDEQEHRCFYCSHPFGGYIRRVTARGERWFRVVVEWDHYTPYSYSQNNALGNFVAACRQCNWIKKARMFQTVEQARVTILHDRVQLGYRPW